MTRGNGEGPPPLVLVRHGESEWNRDGRFTGWTDVDLTGEGEQQARRAGRMLSDQGWQFDLACTSLLKRTIRSQWLMLEELDQTWIPVWHDWRLNERHYGDLTGKSKAEAIGVYGEQQVLAWRRSYEERPPPIPPGDGRDVATDRRYRHISPVRIPRNESLHDTVARIGECWRELIRPAIEAGNRLIVCGHGNGLRALVKILDGLSDDEIVQLDIPNGMPLVYWFDREMQPICRGYLEEPVERESNIL